MRYWVTEKIEMALSEKGVGYKLVLRSFEEDGNNPGRFGYLVDKETFDKAQINSPVEVKVTLLSKV